MQLIMKISCDPREGRTAWICLRHREPQFIFLGGISFCQSSRVKLRETIRHKFAYGLNTWNLRWEMGVVSLQLCFSKAHGASRTHRVCPGGVTILMCLFPAPWMPLPEALGMLLAPQLGNASGVCPALGTSLSCTSPRPGQGFLSAGGALAMSRLRADLHPASPLSDWTFGIIQALIVLRAEQRL